MRSLRRSGAQHAHQGHLEPERRADAAGALEADLATHQLDDALGDDQPEAGAPQVPGGGTVGLIERLEEPWLVLRPDSRAGVTHHEAQGRALRLGLLRFDPDRHRSLPREADGVAHQVEEHLAQADGVAVETVLDRGIDFQAQIDLALLGLGREEPEDVAHQLLEAEIPRAQCQAAGLDPGQVEDVVDQDEERLGGGADQLHLVALGGGETAPEQQLGHAEDAVHGGADLVADVGQEPALGAVRGTRLLLRPLAVLDLALERRPEAAP